MCGIIAAVSNKNIIGIMLEGLKSLEYRGYDSAGIAVLNENRQLKRIRCTGKVSNLLDKISKRTLAGNIGIAHTRWATHGVPSERNAHPQFSDHKLGVVHNGIIENYASIRTKLENLGYIFTSDTDTEVIAHVIHHTLKIKKSSNSIVDVMKAALTFLQGSYGIALLSPYYPNSIIASKKGSPLIIGIGKSENFLASDRVALYGVASRFIYLEDNDIVELRADSIKIWDRNGKEVTRNVVEDKSKKYTLSKGKFSHYMLKEIYEQPDAMKKTLNIYVNKLDCLSHELNAKLMIFLSKINNIQIIGCGTSYHAGMIACQWLESLGHVPCQIEVASEFRYKNILVPADTLLIAISQSGETADTLAALRRAKTLGFVKSLAICNISTSSLVRESDLAFLTKAGTEIGVASTKAFTTQLVCLLLLSMFLAKSRNNLEFKKEKKIIQSLRNFPDQLNSVLKQDAHIKNIANIFSNKSSALFIARGAHFPVVMEGALKLKELSYIHAEACLAGELKHGSLALVDSDIPVLFLLPNNEFIDKVKSSIEEVRSRGGKVIIFTEKNTILEEKSGIHILRIPIVKKLLSPILYTIPLQILAYHVGVIKGRDIDQPRNLAKSVTVE